MKEIYFWSDIMSDHADFILGALSYREKDAIKKANYFKEKFTAFGKETGMNHCNAEQLKCLVLPVLEDFITFKKELLKGLLQCNIELSFTPTFIDHMINEALEFKKALKREKHLSPQEKMRKNIHLHLTWLPDAIGHVAAVTSGLDYVETDWLNEGIEFKKKFCALFIKTSELSLALERTNLLNGALDYLNKEVVETIEKFIVYLNKIRDLREDCKLLGFLNPLVPDHMIREEKYYLANIQMLYQDCV